MAQSHSRGLLYTAPPKANRRDENQEPDATADAESAHEPTADADDANAAVHADD
ncbi:hypothetical protein [Halobacterium zhouii]|uniref:hypothetical protein n=1 Tax=Halobacterium zhouii TaxID=2902624 RepID=UPI001E563A86|nr:hypothetical protein [Halobacterium zhouii]